MSVCASPNVLSTPIVHRYILTNAVNYFGKRKRDRVRTIWFLDSYAMEVTTVILRHGFARRPHGCCTNTKRCKVVRKEFYEIDGRKTIKIGVCTWNIGQRYGRTNIRNSLVDLFSSRQVAKYAINLDTNLLSLDSLLYWMLLWAPVTNKTMRFWCQVL